MIMKKKTQKILAVALGSLLSLSLFAACGGETQGDAYVKSALADKICYDNLSSGYIDVADTQYQLELKKDVAQIAVSAVDSTGKEVDAATVATFDRETGVLTAKGEGVVTLSLQDGSGKQLSSVRVECAPAYTVNPKNQYNLSSANDYSRNTSKLAGGCHDPSLIEVEENGAPAYYIFSTGWNQGNEIRRSTDMIHWEYTGKATAQDVYIPEIEDWMEEQNAASDANTSGKGSIQWWAPDIVPAYGGGYWLYTCNVSNQRHRNSDPDSPDMGEQNYSKACITLFYSKSLEPETFSYVGVLMQSCIPEGSLGGIDVNSIDPQIIYDTDGKMYMAYGSFGTGNWMLELNPQTGLRKDGKNEFLDWVQVRKLRYEATSQYNKFNESTDVSHDYYGKMISKANMEAPVIARHDNVVLSDETGILSEEAKTYYYSMHSYNGLDVAYMMWGGRSESPWGKYLSVNGGYIYNQDKVSNNNSGNKYMGTFAWANRANTSIDIMLPGHNDLFTMSNGTNIAAYITRTNSFTSTKNIVFLTQTHQYYLNSLGDLVINPNRYGGEVDRAVSKEELLHFTKDNKFKMVVLGNDDSKRTSVDVTLNDDNTISYNGQLMGSWVMYGKGYIKFQFTDTSPVAMLSSSGESVFYGVVRPAWLDDQNKSGFTITCMGHSGRTRSMAMFMNNYSNITL